MKNIWIIPFSALALSLSSCEKAELADDSQNTENGEAGKIKVSFKAETPQWSDGSRTSLEEGNKVFWTKGDEVMLISSIGDGYHYWNSGYMEFEGEKSQTATISIYISPQPFISHFFFYPHGNLFSTDYDKIYFNIPTIQTAVAGSFANGVNPTWAITDKREGNLQFHNAAALVKFTLTEGCEDIRKISLTPVKENVSLSGDFCFNLSDVDNITISPSDHYEAYHSAPVVLEGEFTPGEPYYFVACPIDRPLEDGFTFTFEKSDGSKFVKKAKAGVVNELYSGRIANLGEISLAGAEFTNNILDKDFISAVEESCGIAWTKNEDGSVPLTTQNLEAMKAVTSLNISGKGLSDFSYLKYFTGLQELDCSSNVSSELDLNYLVNLTHLKVRNNNLSKLHIDKLTNLISLDCAQNKLSELNVDNLTNLTELDCYNNNITELNLSGLTNLSFLSCSLNDLKSLDLSNLTNLETVYCGSNYITDLKLENLENLVELQCGSNRFSTLDVSNLKNLTILYCDNCNYLTSLNVNGADKLNLLSFKYSTVNSIDLGNMPNLMYLYFTGSALTELNTAGCPLLAHIQCGDLVNFNGVLDFSKNTELTYIHCNNSNISALDLSNNTKLRDLYCAENYLSELNLEKNRELKYLYCLNQKIGEGNKLKLYLNAAQKSIWDNISASHGESVEAYIDKSVVIDNSHGSFGENDCTGVLD